MLIWSHEAFVSALALSLLHSLWQGALVGLLGLALNKRLRLATPDVRCGAFSLLLLTFFLVWLGTFGFVYHEKSQNDMIISGTQVVFANQTLPAASYAQTGDSALVTLLHSASPLLVAFWTLGVCALSLRHIGGFLLLHRLSRSEITVCPPAWEACAVRFKIRLGIRRSIQLKCSTRIDVPFAFGLFKSSILLPLQAMTGLGPEQAEALIAHELAHFARHDVLLNFFQVCIETILFYHPVVRWLSSQIRAAREQACDDLTIQIIGDRALYARALFSLEEARASIPQLALGAKGDTSKMTNTHLIRRIQRVLGTAGPERRDPWAKGSLALGAAALGIAALLPVYAQSPKPGTPTATVPAAPKTTQTTATTHVMLYINGKLTELDLATGTLTPDTKVTVNGKVGRFGDLPDTQQKELKDSIHIIPATLTKGVPAMITVTEDRSTRASSMIASSPSNIHVTATEGNPSTFYVTAAQGNPPLMTITTDGSQDITKNFSTMETGPMSITLDTKGDGSTAKAFITKADGSQAQIVMDTNILLNINGDKIELNTTDLTPETPVTVNGITGRFGDLTSTQQKQLQETVSKMPPPIALKLEPRAGDQTITVFRDLATNSSSPDQKVSTTHIFMNINGDKIELNTTTPTPDTQVTVNGVTGRFGDLTPMQQKQITEHLQANTITVPVTVVQGNPLTLDSAVTAKDTINGKTFPVLFNVQTAVATKPATTVNLPVTVTKSATTINLPVTFTSVEVTTSPTTINLPLTLTSTPTPKK